MKKTILGLAIAAAVASTGAQAQNTGGQNAFLNAMGKMGPAQITAAAAGGLIAAGFVASTTGSGPTSQAPEVTPPTGTPLPPPLTCNGQGELVDGVCIGTTITVTVSGNGTVTVPVTYTFPAVPAA